MVSFYLTNWFTSSRLKIRFTTCRLDTSQGLINLRKEANHEYSKDSRSRIQVCRVDLGQ